MGLYSQQMCVIVQKWVFTVKNGSVESLIVKSLIGLTVESLIGLTVESQ